MIQSLSYQFDLEQMLQVDRLVSDPPKNEAISKHRRRIFELITGTKQEKIETVDESGLPDDIDVEFKNGHLTIK